MALNDDLAAKVEIFGSLYCAKNAHLYIYSERHSNFDEKVIVNAETAISSNSIIQYIVPSF